MARRIVEITQNHYLSVERGFLRISQDKQLVARLPIDSVEALILHSDGAVCSANTLHRMALEKIPVVICDGARHTPTGFLLSLDGNYHQGAVMDAQISSALPLNKRLWQKIISAKVSQQAGLVNALGKNNARLLRLAKEVSSGDVTNCESQAARIYFPLVFGSSFKRNRYAKGINSLLNYGYMVLRAGVLRHIVAAGLHPTVGIFHRNRLNAMRLGDDVMEPFRPFVDWLVFQLAEKGETSLNPEIKTYLAALWQKDTPNSQGICEFWVCVQALAKSVAKSYLTKDIVLDLPKTLTPAQWKNFAQC
jgi:CRISPR-associated protein Cas1